MSAGFRTRGQTVLAVDENNNLVSETGSRDRSFSRRQFLVLLAAVGLVGVVATVGFLPQRQSAEQVPLSRSARSTALTVEFVRKHAEEVGSKPPSNLKDLEKQDEVCYTQGCLEAAIHLLDSINFTVNPCDDFFDFACGNWIAKNEIPASSSRWSQFNMLREEVNKITQGILTSDKNDADALPINQVKDFYRDCVNVDALEQAGVQPLRDVLKLHGDWPLLLGETWETTGFNWLTTVADLRRVYLDTAIISVYVDQDYQNADFNTIYVDQPSLVLPRDILINEDGAYDIILTAYKEYIIEAAGVLAAAAGENPDAAALATQADEIIAFERSLARISSKDEDRSDTARMYNPFTIQAYQEITDEYANLENLGVLNWKTFLDNVFSTSGVTLSLDDTIIVLEMAYIQNLTEILEASTPRIVSNYLQLRYVSGLGGETVQLMRDVKFKFNQVLTGAKEPPTREKACADAANNGLGMAIGVKYIEQTFDDAAKKDVDDMVEDLRVSFKELLASAEWMDEVTKAKAQEKADLMKSFMAYPEWLSNKTAIEFYYDGLEIVDAQHFQSITQLSQWSGDKTLKNLRNPVDRNYWLTYPGVVNAFYAPTYNSITFPAGILQPPFFGKGYPAFLNYGGIGVVIGHEITHGFDNSGRQFDKNGNAIPWWTEETLAQYTEKANCIRDQYSAYKPPEVDLFVNGQLTLGENIADNGGLRESYIAYKKYVADNGIEGRLPGLEQYSPEQLFFMGYANVWCEAITVQGLTNQILTDPHSPARFRVRGPLSNNADFAEKWACPVGSTMNPDPATRCILW